MSERDQLDLDFERFCRHADLEALGRVFDRTAPQLMRIALWLCGHRADAEDAVQRAFVQAIDARACFDSRRGALPWLIGLLTHQVGKIRRERSRKLLPLPQPAVADPAVLAASNELQAALAAVVAQLGPAYHDVLRLHLQDGLDAHDIATRLQRPRGTVRTQLMRGLQSLRQRLPSGFVAGMAPTWWQEASTQLGGEVRNRVLEHASAQFAAPSLGGALARRWVIAALAVGAASLAIYATHFDSSSLEPLVAISTAEQPEQTPTEIASTASGEALPTANPALREAAPPRWGTLVVDVVWNDDGTPAVGQAVLARTSGHRLRELHAGTDERGRCMLTGIEPGIVTLQNDGKYPEVPLAAGETRSITLQRSRGLRLRGRVVDEDGKCVAAATLVGQCDGMSRLPVVIARSGADGAFDTFVPPGTQVHARHASFAPSQQRTFGNAQDAIQATDFVMRGVGATLHGQVRDARGTPVPFAVMSAKTTMRSSSSSLGGWSDPPALLGRADAEGHYRLEGLPACTCQVQAWGIGCAPWAGDVSLAVGGEQRFDPVLGPGATIVGSVRDAAGRPVHCGVDIDKEWGVLGDGSAATDEHGDYRLDSLAPGPTRIVAAEGSAGRAETTLSLRSGETTRWDARLNRGRVVQGVVVDAHGIAIAKATVGWQPPGGHYQKWTQTDAAGAFELLGLPEQPIDVCVFGTGFVVITSERVRAPANSIVLRVLEAPTASLRGRVVDATGRPMSARIMIGRSGARTRPDGCFERGSLPSGNYDIQVYFDGPDWFAWQSVQLGPGETKDLGDYVWHPPHTLVVRCTNADGSPTKDGFAHAEPDSPGAGSGHAPIHDGVARITGLQPRGYRVIAAGDRKRGETSVAMVPDRDNDVEVRLGPVVTCIVRCTSPQSLPAGSTAEIEAVDAAGKVHRGKAPITDDAYEGGNLSLPRGKYAVRARFGDTLTGEQIVDVAAPWFGENVCPIAIPLQASAGR
jgi:RNA polymerase sigma-70 factor (ECF subfamily)